MTLEDIEKVLNDNGFKKVKKIISDSTYARPTSNYLNGKYYTFYRAWLTEHNLNRWKAKWDCDNFAATYYVFAQMCHFKSEREEQGIAVGMLFYHQANGGGHVINLVITEKGLTAIEPQTGDEVRLTDGEKSGASLIYF